MESTRAYAAPAIVSSGPLVIHDTIAAVPLSRAIAIALSYAIKDREPQLAHLIHPVGAQFEWRKLPEWVQDRFYAICGEFGLGDRKRPGWSRTVGDTDAWPTSIDVVRTKLFQV